MGKKTIVVEYSHNNSGGSWWLKEKHWLALEKAGWTVMWGNKYFCRSKYESFNKKPEGKPEPCVDADRCHGHRRADSLDEAKAGKLDSLGAWACYAEGQFESLEAAIRSWEAATGMDASDNGCNCCGAPHSFSEKDGGYASGSAVAEVLCGEPETLDEAKELIRRLRQ